MLSSTKIAQSAETVGQYMTSLQTQVAPLSRDFVTRMHQEVEMMKVRLEKDLTAVSENMQPQAQQMLASIQRQVQELKERTAAYAEGVDPEALKAVVMQKSQEMRAELDKNMVQLQAQMVPYTEDMRQKMEQSMEEFQRRLVPLAQSFETQVNLKTQEIQQSLAQQGEELRTRLDASAQDLQAQLTALWESFTKKTQ